MTRGRVNDRGVLDTATYEQTSETYEIAGVSASQSQPAPATHLLDGDDSLG